MLDPRYSFFTDDGILHKFVLSKTVIVCRAVLGCRGGANKSHMGTVLVGGTVLLGAQ